jgi:hypothetical protein
VVIGSVQVLQKVQPVGSGDWRRGWRWWLVSGVWWRVSSATELAAPL